MSSSRESQILPMLLASLAPLGAPGVLPVPVRCLHCWCSMQYQHAVLLDRLDHGEPHIRDRPASQIASASAYVCRRHEPSLIAKCRYRSSPMLRCNAGLDADDHVT